MTRVLVAARVRVPPASLPRWLGAAGALARRYSARGQHLWVFRHEHDPELHLEFREGPSRERLAPADPDETALAARLAALGSYQDADILWESVSLPAGD